MDQHQSSNGFQAMPIFLQSPQQPWQHDRLRAEVPPRVEKAFELLRALTLKTSVNMAGKMERSGSQDMGTLTIDGQRLTIEEEQAGRAAMSLLTLYFDGKLKESGWDGVRERQAEKDDDPAMWNEIQCPNCMVHNPGMRGNCLMCGNAGRVRVARVS